MQWRQRAQTFQSTLPQGERLYTQDWQLQTGYFNPRSREGSDVTASPPLNTPLLFQSTLPRWERLCRGSVKKQLHHFNPRSREGSDQFLGEQDLIGNNTFLPRYSPSSSHIYYSDEIFYSRQWNVRITYTLLLISIYPARSPVLTKYRPSAAHIPPTSHHPVCASCRDSGICHPLQPYGLR